MVSSALLLLPGQMNGNSLLRQSQTSSSSFFSYEKKLVKRPRSAVPLARLFGPSIFEASKLKVLFLGVDDKKHPGNLPRTYTLTHSDITSKITLAVSQTINRAQLQGWYNRLQRDEVVAHWKKLKGKMSLHVHCHISGGHFLLDFIAHIRHYIFSKELPVVLMAFVHGDGNLFNAHPELEDSMVWVYFHSNLQQYNRVECWGPLREAAVRGGACAEQPSEVSPPPEACGMDCSCCFPRASLLPWPQEFAEEDPIELSNVATK